MSKWSANFQFSEKVKVQSHRTWETSRNCRISGANCNVRLTIVRPNLLSMPETVNNWTLGHVIMWVLGDNIFSCLYNDYRYAQIGTVAMTTTTRYEFIRAVERLIILIAR